MILLNSFLFILFISLSFPPFYLFPFAFFAFVPFFIVISKVRKKFLWGTILGSVFSSFQLFWLFNLTRIEKEAALWITMGVPLLFIYHGLYFGLFAYLFCKFKNIRYRFLILSLLWVILEIFKSSGETGFPWLLIFLSQKNNIYLIQIIEYTGVFFISFLIIYINFLFYSKRFFNIFKAFVIIMIFELWGFYIFNKKEEPFKEIKIAIYQPHIPLVYSSSQELLLAERIYDSLSFYSKGAVLSIFPESALPGFLRRDTFVLRVVKNFVNKTRSFLILGNADYRRKNKRIRIYNTAFLIDKNGNIVDHYNKVHLTPFGEALPYDEKFPFLRKFQFGQGNYSRGEEIRPFDLPFGKVQVLICFESIFPYISREGVGKGANIIVNITSDGWFGKSLGPKVHRDLAIFRAIETRRYILRSARSGISCIIDEKGRIIKELPLFKRGIIEHNVYLFKRKTFFVKYGNFFFWIYFLGFFVLLFISKRKKM